MHAARDDVIFIVERDIVQRAERAGREVEMIILGGLVERLKRALLGCRDIAETQRHERGLVQNLRARARIGDARQQEHRPVDGECGLAHFAVQGIGGRQQRQQRTARAICWLIDINNGTTGQISMTYNRSARTRSIAKR